jgi:hypothetical protein
MIPQFFNLKLLTNSVIQPATISLYRRALSLYILFFTLLQLPVASQIWSPNSLLPVKFYDASLPLQALNLLSHTSIAPYYWFFLLGLLVCCLLTFFTKRTQFISILIYFFFVNLYHRSITIQNASADLIKIQLFFLLFMNENAGNYKYELSKQFFSTLSNFAFFASKIQLLLVYMIASISKLGDTNWVIGTALYFVALNEEYSLEFFKSFALLFPSILKFLTWLVLGFQLIFPILVWSKKIKPYLFLFGIVMHLSIAILMGIPDFGLIMLVMYLLFCSEPWSIRITEKLKLNLLPIN